MLTYGNKNVLRDFFFTLIKINYLSSRKMMLSVQRRLRGACF